MRGKKACRHLDASLAQSLTEDRKGGLGVDSLGMVPVERSGLLRIRLCSRGQGHFLRGTILADSPAQGLAQAVLALGALRGLHWP